jgi:hypothetical protein
MNGIVAAPEHPDTLQEVFIYSCKIKEKLCQNRSTVKSYVRFG